MKANQNRNRLCGVVLALALSIGTAQATPIMVTIGDCSFKIGPDKLNLVWTVTELGVTPNSAVRELAIFITPKGGGPTVIGHSNVAYLDSKGIPKGGYVANVYGHEGVKFYDADKGPVMGSDGGYSGTPSGKWIFQKGDGDNLSGTCQVVQRPN